MKVTVRYSKSDSGDVSATLTLERGGDDPAMIAVDGTARSFASGSRLDIFRQFGHHAGKDASDWAETAIADIKHQVDEYRTTVPADYSIEY